LVIRLREIVENPDAARAGYGNDFAKVDEIEFHVNLLCDVSDTNHRSGSVMT
jgi:hypothetical protein